MKAKSEHRASRGNLAQQAYDHISHAILTGRLQAGTVVSEQLLAQEIGISRTPVGQALLEHILASKKASLEQYDQEQLRGDTYLQSTLDLPAELQQELTRLERTADRHAAG